jgi:hypothetical protein
MNTFAFAIDNQESRTTNGMKARASTANPLVDMFFKIGALRGQNPLPTFIAAYEENKEIALRILLWARDVRSGAGERQVFRDVLKYLDETNPEAVMAILHKIPELGRWDDLLVVKSKMNRPLVVDMIRSALNDGNGLVAKWLPRKGLEAVTLRKELGLTPKSYRKLIVSLTNVVETSMCAKWWDEIDFSKVPSLAAARYKNAFTRNAKDRYQEYLSKLSSGDKSVKVNAGAVYPYDVIKDIRSGISTQLISSQWKALPNYVGDKNIFPMIDVSGSMFQPVSGSSGVLAVDVAISLGLYIADKNIGKFKDSFLTFSHTPEIVRLSGDIVAKYYQMKTSEWAMSTNLHSAFNKILEVAKNGNVSNSEMPEALLIISDMQFNSCTRYDDSAMEMIRRKYEESGYELPQIIFWNVVARGNVPVSFNEKGVGLISGFSPAIVKNVLSGKNLDPYSLMMDTISSERYNFDCF